MATGLINFPSIWLLFPPDTADAAVICTGAYLSRDITYLPFIRY